MKLKISLLGLLCLIFQANAQPTGNTKTLMPGDNIPDIHISGVLNYTVAGKPASELRLSDFKDKLLILDFWATYCTPCIRLLPKHDSLQNEFDGKIQFLLVSPEKSQTVAAFFKRNRSGLPSVTEDILLGALFPHNSIPHEVWIKNGQVIAITYAEAITRPRILSVLGGWGTAIEQKQDDLGFDPLEPLLANGNGQGTVLYQSLITPYIPGINSASGFQRSPEKVISVALNSSVAALYHQAFSHIDPAFAQDSRFIYEIPDSLHAKLERGTQSTFHEWIKKYGFCYDLVLPPGYTGDIASLMVSDLNRFFGSRYHISAVMEKRPADCLVLSRLTGSRTIESKGGTPVINGAASRFLLKNQPMEKLVTELAYRYRAAATPVIDESGYQKNVDLAINCDSGDLDSLNKELAKSGLILRSLKRTIDMVVFRMLTCNQPNLSLNLNSN